VQSLNSLYFMLNEENRSTSTVRNAWRHKDLVCLSDLFTHTFHQSVIISSVRSEPQHSKTVFTFFIFLNPESNSENNLTQSKSLLALLLNKQIVQNDLNDCNPSVDV